MVFFYSSCFLKLISFNDLFLNYPCLRQTTGLNILYFESFLRVVSKNVGKDG